MSVDTQLLFRIDAALRAYYEALHAEQKARADFGEDVTLTSLQTRQRYEAYDIALALLRLRREELDQALLQWPHDQGARLVASRFAP